MSDNSDYTIGYKKPPIETRFKKGQSGNPKGRPKSAGPTDFDEILERELSRTVHVATTGKRMKLSEVIVSRQIHKAATGDHRATSLILQRLEGRKVAGKEGLSPILDAMRALNAKHEAHDLSSSLIGKDAQQERSLNMLSEDDDA